MGGDSSPCLSVYGQISVKMANDLRVWVRSTKAAQLSGRGARLVQTFDMVDNGTNKSNIIVRDRITMWKRLSSMQLNTMLRKDKRAARVDRRLRRYYLIVRLLPNVFALACLSLSSI